ncbi:MAG: type I-U CRISPR-associated protein Cas7 [Phycisphaerales bacterium]|nr:type I-U CRISPR-associated protein Cas7 [Phycisphaerales bacterium]
MPPSASAIDYAALANAPRLLMECELKPLQGDRFQPTGFADLGPARYTRPDGTEMLLVESAQSVANRLEMAVCQDDKRTLLSELDGLPYVKGMRNGEMLTTSYLEAHRLSSPYVLDEVWAASLAKEMGLRDNFSLNDRSISKTLFKYDPSTLLHGVWLSLKEYKDVFSGGRVRVTRSLSGFIEAEGVSPAEHGGTKFDKNLARTEENADASTGYGTIPFHRSDFVAAKTTAYFNLDLSLLRGYRLGHNVDEKQNEKFEWSDAEKLLIALALFKIQRFLKTGLRLRTACDLEPKGDGLKVKRPIGFAIPDDNSLLNECKMLVARCKQATLFAETPITEVKWQPPKREPKDKKSTADSQDGDDK